MVRRGWMALALLAVSCGSRQHSVTVSAASSLTDVLTDVAGLYERAHPGVHIDLNFGASGMLERQIEQGAPVDVFVSADPKEVHALEEKGLAARSKEAVVATNTLVLIVAEGSPVRSFADLGRAKRIAIGDPETVPAGRYAKQTLQHRRLWSEVSSRLVMTANVRQALAYVTRGDADAGLVFATDAQGARIVDRAESGVDHRPVLYVGVPVSASRTPAEADGFLRFLSSASAQAVFQQAGFGKGP